MYSVGLDIGSTTIKYVVLDEDGKILKKDYLRHMSFVSSKAKEILTSIKDEFGNECYLSFSGSASLGLAEYCKVNFVQEVYSEKLACDVLSPNTDVIIELGGEDAKIVFLSNGLEVRMNGSCAGGTGSFIDQMALLLHVETEKMDELAKNALKKYQIASRCGVFAKSDIQPLINQGATKEDLAKSIFYAICNQTVGGLAQGRKIKGNILYLGGPLTFNPTLRECFDETLKLNGVCPDNSLYYVAIGAALSKVKTVSLYDVINNLDSYQSVASYNFNKPLFNTKDEYDEFIRRHEKATIKNVDLESYSGNSYLGIDSGSTTIKLVLVDEDSNILYSVYEPNKGQAVDLVRKTLLDIYNKYPNIKIKASATTGYGEELIKNAFNIDFGIVETIAHYTSASHFMPNVDFIIDIGGQDMKCFKIKNGAIDNIFLNESCSSGCGSFLQTFANALGYDVIEFANLGLFGDKPVDLGSRCTVFMNSLVKQAQKDGATIENISAGLSMSVVKNALYKVIRIANKEELGKNIVVQGGTFYNNAVLRAFEKETGLEVIRPSIAGLMGAYGAALYAKRHIKDKVTSLISIDEIKNMKVFTATTRCGGCPNNCSLTIHNFINQDNVTKRKYISGNKCEKPITNKTSDKTLNMFEIKRELLDKYRKNNTVDSKTIGIPMVLNMYDLLPFWYTLFTSLNFNVVTSDNSSQKMYLEGQSTIPSDTVCYPAKLVHGHIMNLINKGITNIFYPAMTRNIDEGLGDKNFNCPVVAYYPEVVRVNMEIVKRSDIRYIAPYLGIDQKKFSQKLYLELSKYFTDIKERDVIKAVKLAWKEYHAFKEALDNECDRIIDFANKNNKEIIVLAGRPYHVDKKIDHEIDKLIVNLGACVLTEEMVARKSYKEKTSIINQWTYHARLYAAAQYVAKHSNMNLIQLVSFGCGLDAITTDEVKEILERHDKIYTQIKIDEITNLGAAKIRIRSLLSVVGDKNG